MPAPSVSGLDVTFGASTYLIAGGQRYAITAQTVSLSAPASGSETKRIPWKQGGATDAFAVLNALSFVGRTAISGASATIVSGSAVPAGNVKVHARGKVFTDLTVSDPLAQADVTYSYKRERVDLLELNTATGTVHVVQGTESDYAAAELRPTATPGRLPLYWAYIWNNTVELVPAYTWAGLVPVDSITRARLAACRARNATILAPIAAKLAAGTPITVQGYGDSIMAQGGGWASTGGADDTTYMATAPNGGARDASSYLAYQTPELVTAWGPWQSWSQANDDGSAQHHPHGWARKVAVGLGATWRNWGIGSTTSGTGTGGSGAPNCGDSARLAAINAETADFLLYSAAMNDFVSYATGGMRAALNAVVDSLQAAQPSRKIALVGPPGINAENPNGNSGAYTWWRQAHETYKAVAEMKGCAYAPLELIAHGSPGYMGLTTAQMSAANRYNHPAPLECSLISAFALHALGF